MQIKNIALALAAATAVMFFQNCSKLQPEVITSSGCIKADIESDAATRTSIGEGNTVLWQEGDCISVLSPANMKFTLESGAGTNGAVFSGDEIDKSSGYWALYPYKISAVTVEGDSRVVIPWSGSTQTAIKDSFDPSVALMLGYSTSESVSFKQVLSYIKFTTDFPCTSVVFSSYSNVDVCATSLVTGLDSDGNPTIISFEGGSSTVTLKGKDGALIEPGTYIVAVLPSALTSGFSIRFETAENEFYIHKSASANVTLKRARILNLGAFHAADFGLYGEWLGDGSALHPYLISSKEDLALLQSSLGTTGAQAETYASSHYFMTCDIDYESNTLAIGGVQQFKGTFDGGGHSITNVRPGTYYMNSGYGDHSDGPCYCTAVFPRLFDATVKNLGIVMDNTGPCYNMSGLGTHSIFGGIAAYASSSTNFRTTITNCSFEAGTHSVPDAIQLSGNGYVYWGGILGDNGGHLECHNCTADIDVRMLPDYNYSSSTHCAGGIIGKVESETDDIGDFDITVRITKCRNKGNMAIQGMKDGDAMCGGIIGYVYEALGINNTNLLMSDCVNEGEITPSGNNLDGKSYAGGLIGKHDSDGGASEPRIYNSLNKGYVKAYGKSSWSGGIMGWCYDNDTKVINCANVGEIVNGNSSVGISGGNASDYCANGSGTFSSCKKKSDSPTSSSMNSGRSNIPSVSGLVYADWTGSGSSLDLDI